MSLKDIVKTDNQISKILKMYTDNESQLSDILPSQDDWASIPGGKPNDSIHGNTPSQRMDDDHTIHSILDYWGHVIPDVTDSPYTPDVGYNINTPGGISSIHTPSDMDVEGDIIDPPPINENSALDYWGYVAPTVTGSPYTPDDSYGAFDATTGLFGITDGSLITPSGNIEDAPAINLNSNLDYEGTTNLSTVGSPYSPSTPYQTYDTSGELIISSVHSADGTSHISADSALDYWGYVAPTTTGSPYTPDDSYGAFDATTGLFGITDGSPHSPTGVDVGGAPVLNANSNLDLEGTTNLSTAGSPYSPSAPYQTYVAGVGYTTGTPTSAHTTDGTSHISTDSALDYWGYVAPTTGVGSPYTPDDSYGAFDTDGLFGITDGSPHSPTGFAEDGITPLLNANSNLDLEGTTNLSTAGSPYSPSAPYQTYVAGVGYTDGTPTSVHSTDGTSHISADSALDYWGYTAPTTTDSPYSPTTRYQTYNTTTNKYTAGTPTSVHLATDGTSHISDDSTLDYWGTSTLTADGSPYSPAARYQTYNSTTKEYTTGTPTSAHTTDGTSHISADSALDYWGYTAPTTTDSPYSPDDKYGAFTTTGLFNITDGSPHSQTGFEEDGITPKVNNDSDFDYEGTSPLTTITSPYTPSSRYQTYVVGVGYTDGTPTSAHTTNGTSHISADSALDYWGYVAPTTTDSPYSPDDKYGAFDTDGLFGITDGSPHSPTGFEADGITTKLNAKSNLDYEGTSTLTTTTSPYSPAARYQTYDQLTGEYTVTGTSVHIDGSSHYLDHSLLDLFGDSIYSYDAVSQFSHTFPSAANYESSIESNTGGHYPTSNASEIISGLDVVGDPNPSLQSNTFDPDNPFSVNERTWWETHMPGWLGGEDEGPLTAKTFLGSLKHTNLDKDSFLDNIQLAGAFGSIINPNATGLGDMFQLPDYKLVTSTSGLQSAAYIDTSNGVTLTLDTTVSQWGPATDIANNLGIDLPNFTDTFSFELVPGAEKLTYPKTIFELITDRSGGWLEAHAGDNKIGEYRGNAFQVMGRNSYDTDMDEDSLFPPTIASLTGIGVNEIAGAIPDWAIGVANIEIEDFETVPAPPTGKKYSDLTYSGWEHPEIGYVPSGIDDPIFKELQQIAYGQFWLEPHDKMWSNDPNDPTGYSQGGLGPDFAFLRPIQNFAEYEWRWPFLMTNETSILKFKKLTGQIGWESSQFSKDASATLKWLGKKSWDGATWLGDSAIDLGKMGAQLGSDVGGWMKDSALAAGSATWDFLSGAGQLIKFSKNSWIYGPPEAPGPSWLTKLGGFGKDVVQSEFVQDLGAGLAGIGEFFGDVGGAAWEITSGIATAAWDIGSDIGGATLDFLGDAAAYVTPDISISGNFNPLDSINLPSFDIQNPLNFIGASEYGGSAVFGSNTSLRMPNYLPGKNKPGTPVTVSGLKLRVPEKQTDPKDVLFDGSKPTSQTYSQLGKTKYGKGLDSFYPGSSMGRYAGSIPSSGDNMTMAEMLTGTSLSAAGYGKSGNPLVVESAPQGMPFYIKDLRDNTYIILRGYLDGITEQLSPSWPETKYIGRSEPVYTYENATRTVSFNLKLVAQTELELAAIYAKMRKLTSLVYPEYKADLAMIDPEAEVTPDGQNLLVGKVRMKAPLMSFRIGELFGNNYKNQSGFINSLNYTIPDESPWEFRAAQRVPKYIQAAFGITILHRVPPHMNHNFYGYPYAG